MNAAQMRGLRALLVGLSVLGAPLLAAAHQASDAYLRAGVDADGQLALQVDVALRDLDTVLELDANADGKLSWGEVRTREADIAGHVADRLRLDDGRCRLRALPGLALDRKADGVYALLHYASDCAAAGAPALDYGLFRDTDPTHRGLLVVLDAQGQPTGPLRSLTPGGAPLRLVPSADASGSAGGVDPPAESAPALGFFGEGLHHILIGADHVLFLICLLLPLVLGPEARPGAWRRRLWPLVGLVTAFTVGHSVTLGLASLRVLSVPPSVIEPLIALTIALTALDNIRPFLGRRRAFAAFAFGLIHGFGFAGPLIELQLAPWAMAGALLQFNLGVEAGQLIVVAAATLLLWPLRERGPAGAWLRSGSAFAGIVALVWLGERLFDFKLLPL
ncbi:HupE/UreJ family protein [Methylibium sp.]|uniref:HupE/UreJ family protein n=1 Tax=Methylibium sp. TaxID=2067992 RepID=UPI00333E4C73